MNTAGTRMQRNFGHGLLFSFALLGLALLPLLSPSPARAAFGVASLFVLLALLIAWLSRPRSLHPDQSERLLDELRRSSESATLSLSSSEGERRGRAGKSYAAVARVAGAAPVVLIEAGEPACVLDAALRWQHVHGLSLLPGWGLTEADLSKSRPAVTPSPALERVVGSACSGAKGAAGSLVISAAVLSLLVGLVAALREGELALVSASLWAFGIGVLLLLALAMHSDQVSVSFGKVLRVERRILGITVAEQEFPRDALEVFSVVSPDGTRARHVLVRSAGSSWAVECSAELGADLQACLRSARPRRLS